MTQLSCCYVGIELQAEAHFCRSNGKMALAFSSSSFEAQLVFQFCLARPVHEEVIVQFKSESCTSQVAIAALDCSWWESLGSSHHGTNRIT